MTFDTIKEIAAGFYDLPRRQKIEVFTKLLPILIYMTPVIVAAVIADKLGLRHPDQ